MSESIMINGKVPDPEARACLLAVNDSGLECSDAEEDGVVPEVKITVNDHAPPQVSCSKHSLRSKAKRQSTKDSFRSGNWKLKYRDFTPHSSAHVVTAGKQVRPDKWSASSCHFGKLVDEANEWLRKNTQVQIKSCQTMLWSSGDPSSLEDTAQMVISRNTQENSMTFYKRGLRIWLEPRSDKLSSQTLCAVDFTPDKKNRTIKSLVDKINHKIANKHLKGKIVTIETISQPWSADHKLDTRATKWTEPVNDDVCYSFFLRVFYVKDSSSNSIKLDQNSVVGLKDVIPFETEAGYEAFECLVGRANDWLKTQVNIQVVNLQSVIVKKEQDEQRSQETGSTCYYTMPGLNATTPVDFFRILRIAYVSVPAERAADAPSVYPFNYETFTPEIIKEKETNVERLESMAETFSKVIAFLRNTGADVLGAEMVHYPMQLYTADHCPSNADELNFLYTIRLYLTGQLCFTDGYERSIKRGSVVSTASRRNENRGRDGPIFLRSVVNRQFKYRWLVLALTAISCMSIIVVVSVVYSNR